MCREQRNGGSEGKSSATVRGAENQTKGGYCRDTYGDLCQADGDVHSSARRQCWFAACTVLLRRLKAKPEIGFKKCPRGCESENTRAGDTQAWLCAGLKQSSYVQSYSQTPILISADHISNVDYNSPIV